MIVLVEYQKSTVRVLLDEKNVSDAIDSCLTSDPSSNLPHWKLKP